MAPLVDRSLDSSIGIEGQCTPPHTHMHILCKSTSSGTHLTVYNCMLAHPDTSKSHNPLTPLFLDLS